MDKLSPPLEGGMGSYRSMKRGAAELKRENVVGRQTTPPSEFFLRLLFSQSVLLYMKGFGWGISMEDGASFFPGLAIQLEKTHE